MSASSQSSIKLQFGDIKGQSNVPGFEGWIDIESVALTSNRTISSVTGTQGDRESSLPTLSTINLTKRSCGATSGILNSHLSGEGPESCIVVFLEGGSQGKPVVKKRYILTSPKISSIALSNNSEGTGSEQFGISFTKIEYHYEEKDDRGAIINNYVYNYDLTKGQANV